MRSACSSWALRTSILARIRPASKIGQVIDGPIVHIRLEPKRKLPVLIDSSPVVAVVGKFGKKATGAPPTRAVGAAPPPFAHAKSGRPPRRTGSRPAGQYTA